MDGQPPLSKWGSRFNISDILASFAVYQVTDLVTVFTALSPLCYAELGIVMASRQSVRLSVTFRYCDHIG